MWFFEGVYIYTYMYPARPCINFGCIIPNPRLISSVLNSIAYMYDVTMLSNEEPYFEYDRGSEEEECK